MARLANPMPVFVPQIWAGLTAGAFVATGAFRAGDTKGFTEPIKGTALSIAMIEVDSGDPAKPLWMSRTEIPWEVVDVYVYGFDKHDGVSDPPAADAVTRPTKPYIATDRGFGHAGWPANSVSFPNANAFCEWLSAKTGRRYRLPTVAEWKRACEKSRVDAATATEFAWFDDNSDGTSHKVGTKTPDAQGLCDLAGNLAEWCVEPDGTGSVMGGSYRDASDEIGCEAIEEDTPNWNMSDPQIPKSIWWLADAGWIGFRVVCDGPAPAPAPVPTPAPQAKPNDKEIK